MQQQTSPTDIQKEQITLLYRLSKIMHTMTDLSKALNACLRLMAKSLQMMRGTITLLSPETGEIHIHAPYGLIQEEQERGPFLKGEGITGRVIETGKPMYISNVSKNPLFLNKTRSRDLKKESISFLCVPIMLHQDIVGALSVDQLLSDTPSLEAELRLLEIIASILGHAAMECQRRMDIQKPTSHRPQDFIGSSSEMENVYQLINQPVKTVIISDSCYSLIYFNLVHCIAHVIVTDICFHLKFYQWIRFVLNWFTSF